MHGICIVYAWYMHSICIVYAKYMQSICIVYAKYVHSMCIIVYALYVQLIMVSVTTMLDPHMYTMDHVSNPATALGPNFKDLFDTHRAIDLVLNSGT